MQFSLKKAAKKLVLSGVVPFFFYIRYVQSDNEVFTKAYYVTLVELQGSQLATRHP